MSLSTDELKRLWVQAGGNPAAASTAAAVAYAESSGNPGAMGDIKLQTSTWGPSVGLWQIRSLNAQRGRGGQRDAGANTDPLTNARNAVAISNNGTNFGPWSTFKSGAYRRYLNGAAGGSLPAGVTAPGAGGKPTDPLGGVVDSITNAIGAPFGSIADSLSVIHKLTMPETWVRIMAGLFGFGLVGIGVYTLTKEVRT